MDNAQTLPQATKKVRVRCTLDIDIDVDVPADMDDHSLQFAIEENSCPGTSWVGSAIDKHLEKYNTEMVGFCWACALNGTNMILKDRPAHHTDRL